MSLANRWLLRRFRRGRPVSIQHYPVIAALNKYYEYKPTIYGNVGTTTYALTGTLPAGLSFSTSTGKIVGTPTVAGAFGPFTLTVTDTKGSDSLSGFNIIVK